MLFINAAHSNHSHMFEEYNSEASDDTCVNDLSDSANHRFNAYYAESESCDSVYRCASSNTLFISNSIVESISYNNGTSVQESFQHSLHPSLSVNVLGHSRYSPSHDILTVSCSGISVDEIVMQENVLFPRKLNEVRGDGSSSSSDEDDDDKNKRSHSSFPYHFHSYNPHQTVQGTSHCQQQLTLVSHYKHLLVVVSMVQNILMVK